ncbi:MAG: hypothetical protein HZC48_07805 [Nitrospirae bacterium]|nr:hypothetical protein [Nitrospirota bacterium]
MEKRTYIDTCKLGKLRLLECSSKFIKPDIEQSITLGITMKHSVKFDVHPKENKYDFYLSLNTELKAIDNDKNEYFQIISKFRGDYLIIDSDNSDPKDFKKVTELLGNQLFPVIRAFLTNILNSMEIPLTLPWSLQRQKDKKVKKKNVKNLT